MVAPDTRRHFLLGAIATFASACAHSRSSAETALPARTTSSLPQVEQTTRGRLGVFALDTQTGQALEHRADERFAMCSTFKWVLAAQVLARVDRSLLSLAERIPYGPADVLEHAPVARQHVNEGSMSVEDLARASVVVSDNTAANLLLAKLGGPAGFTQFVRSVGDSTTRLDRIEPELNGNLPGDERDTTSPRAMVHLMGQILTGSVLSSAGRERLLGWLKACETGKNRLRAGLPPEWVVGDKTGTGDTACNDVAIAFPPGRAPVLIAVYLSHDVEPLDLVQKAHADVARLVAAEMGR
ncbi:MAG TPA: class A beta-lactamase [Polyangiaceae bacterium]|nr:class A beta-lactamase [Polyangiaceae bacterium]